MIITIKDETFGGKVLSELSMEFKSERVSVREIISGRVTQEVDNYNRKRPDYFNGLVEPTEAEKTINGFRLKPKKFIDGEQQVYTALDAFQKNGFFVLVDTVQAESLDQVVELRPDTKISFVKLTPLVGG